MREKYLENGVGFIECRGVIYRARIAGDKATGFDESNPYGTGQKTEAVSKEFDCHPELVEGSLYPIDFMSWFDRLTMTLQKPELNVFDGGL